MTWQNPEPLGFAASRVEELFVAQELINKVKLKCCGIQVFSVSGQMLRALQKGINIVNGRKVLVY